VVCWLGLIFCSFGSQIGISWPLVFDQPNSIVSVSREAIVTSAVVKRSKFQKNFADGVAFSRVESLRQGHRVNHEDDLHGELLELKRQLWSEYTDKTIGSPSDKGPKVCH
jgi:hypothetical protein